MGSVLRNKANREDLLALLKGQAIQINGLQETFSPWIVAVNPALDWLRNETTEWVKDSFPTHTKLDMFIKSDFALFGATWFPYAPNTSVRIATRLAIWLFVWDDEIDHGDHGLALQYERAKAFRDETHEYIKSSLGLSSDYTSYHPVIVSFDSIGHELRTTCTEFQRTKFLEAVQDFIDKQDFEQKIRLDGTVPTEQTFWQYRLGTSAVEVAIAMNEYCNMSHLPTRVLEDAEMMELTALANQNFCAVNDLVSLRKEIKSGSIESIVPVLLVNREITAQDAVDQVMATYVREPIKQIDRLAQELMRKYSKDLSLGELGGLWLYIEGIKNLTVANMSWSLVTDRYGLNVSKGNANKIVVEL